MKHCMMKSFKKIAGNFLGIMILATSAATATASKEDVKSLFDAVLSGNSADLQKALKSGVDIDVKREFTGYTPLHEAVLRGDNDLVMALILAGADVDAEGTYGETPLHLASYKDNKGAVSALIKVGNANVNCQDSRGLTPLDITIAKQLGNVDKFLSTYVAEEDSDDEDDWYDKF